MIYLITTFLIFLILFEIILLKNSSKIAISTSLIDKPDFIRKFHKKPVPLLGGLILCTIILLNKIGFFIFDIVYLEFEFILFLIILTFFGLFDDKFNLNANLKLLFLIAFFVIFFYLIMILL